MLVRRRVRSGREVSEADVRVNGVAPHLALPLRVPGDVEAGLGRFGGDSAAGGDGRIDGHHLGVHRERLVDEVAAAERPADELKLRNAGEVALIIRQGWRLDGGGTVLDAAGLEGAAVVSGTVVIEALTDDLSALDDDAAVTVAEGRERRLLQTDIQVLVGLHCDFKREIGLRLISWLQGWFWL